MLNVLRESFTSRPYLKWVLALVGASFVLYLGNYFVGGDGAPKSSAWVARVNGRDISQARYRDVANQLDRYYRELFGASYEQMKSQIRVGRQAIESLIEKEIVLQDAARMGLQASAADVARQIRSHPSLQEDGRFIGKERYKQALERNYPGGVAAFERLLGEDIIVAQWTAFVTRPLTVSDEELADLFRERTEKTALSYVLFPAADPTGAGEVSEGELKSWYEGHLEDYSRPEGRDIRYVVLDRDSRLEAIEIASDEIRAHYEANRATYSHPDQRRASHILFEVVPDAAEADKAAVRREAEGALERLRGGADFKALAAELSDDTVSAARGGDLDFFGRGQMLPSFEEAVFATPVGELALLTETPHGFHVILVTDARPAGVRPLEDVQDDIRHILRLRKVDPLLLDEARRLREAMGGAERFAEVAGREGLSVSSAFFTPSERLGTLGPSPDFRSAVGVQEPGTLSEPLPVASGVALVVVDGVRAAGPAPFEDVRAQVEQAVRKHRAQDAAVAAARVALARHPELVRLAKAERGGEPSTAEVGPGQGLPGGGVPSPELTEALFGSGATVGRSGVAPVGDGAVVYEITGREPFDPARFAHEKDALREQALQSRREGYRQAILERLRTRQRVEYNPQWLELIDRG